ncbi:hypothetical protein PI125_g16757 [Phytophthora idaei]|nr:hypothetical protein PI125_g16757 [Phytophthora idaei]KAG3136465.1 hypothetical protein PI126_g17815 [Phytophthora idaei]
MRNMYGQVVRVTACIIEGCTSEFFVGVDFMKEHKANMDFDRNEVRYYEKELMVVIPFRTEDNRSGEARQADTKRGDTSDDRGGCSGRRSRRLCTNAELWGRHAGDHGD